MGLLDKFFKKEERSSANSNDIEMTGQMMDEDLYWKLVANSLENSSSQDEQEAYLIKALEKLSPADIIGFSLRTDKLLYDTYSSGMWCAAYVINGGCSDDGFEYFRRWLISRGREAYYSAKASPDLLINVAIEGDENEFESFSYVALQAFKNRTGKDLYNYIDNSFKFREGDYPKIEFTWQEENPESMRAICPKLFDKFRL